MQTSALTCSRISRQLFGPARNYLNQKCLHLGRAAHGQKISEKKQAEKSDATVINMEINIDRPQTDNLLLSHDGIPLTQKTETKVDKKDSGVDKKAMPVPPVEVLHSTTIDRKQNAPHIQNDQHLSVEEKRHLNETHIEHHRHEDMLHSSENKVISNFDNPPKEKSPLSTPFFTSSTSTPSHQSPSHQSSFLVSSNVRNELQSITKPEEKSIVVERSGRYTVPMSKRVMLTDVVRSDHAVSFEEVPGPQTMRFLSDLVKAIPVIGTQTITSLMQSVNRLCVSYGNAQILGRNIKPFNMLFDSYGEIVCLRIPFCGDLVLVQRPEHISAIYNQRSLSQVSLSCFDSLNEFHKRKARRHFDMNLNLTQEIKDIFKENFEAKKIFWSSSKYHESLEKTSDEFVSRILSIRNIHDEVPHHFHKELYSWGLECMMQTLFGTRLGFYKPTDQHAPVEAEKVLQAFVNATDALRSCENGLQMWRLYNTSSWTKLNNSCDSLESTLAKHIRMSKLHLDIALKMMMATKDFKQSATLVKSSLVKALILSGCVRSEQLLKFCLDMTLVGVNASATSLGFVFYHLARSPNKQQRLYKELLSVMPKKNSALEQEHLQHLPYLNACVTESIRLRHPIPYSLMRLSQNIIINKYFIPAGTYVMTANEVACMKEENFDEPEKFKPERWLDHKVESLEDAVVPLSEGTRTFLGRDWLQQQLCVATAKVIRNFNIEYHYGIIKTNGRTLSKPSKPFQFKFEERAV